MTTPEQTNERPGTSGGSADTREPDASEAGRPRIRPGPGEDPEPRGDRGGSAPDGELNPDQTDAGRPRIRPGPGEDPQPRGDRAGGSPDGELDPDQGDAGRPRIRPGPGEG